MMTDRITKKMIDLQRSTLDMMLDTVSNIQEQSGRATRAWLEQVSGLPQEGVKTMGQWMESMRQSRKEFNAILRDGYDEWGNIFEENLRKAEETTRQSQQSA